MPYEHRLDIKNKEDYQWMIVRTLLGEELKLNRMLTDSINGSRVDNILETYCPVKSTVLKPSFGKSTHTPLFAGHVFVLATQQALSLFLSSHYPEGHILYARKVDPNEKAKVWTVPEAQMKIFRDFNENYADKVIVLERPYSTYAFNEKTNQPNAIVKVVDGPLAGRIGYLTRFRGDRRLVFNMKSPFGPGECPMAIPDIWNFHCVLLHNAENDITSMGTMKARAVDLLIGTIQGCGYDETAIDTLHTIIDMLCAKPSLVHLCQSLFKNHRRLSQALTQLTAEQAELIMHLTRYEQQDPGYVKRTWHTLVLRPFLTPTSGIAADAGKTYATLKHPHFTEYIIPQTISESVFYPSKAEEKTNRTTYYAHIGAVNTGTEGKITLFANWDDFLKEYFLTADKANTKLVRGRTKITAPLTGKKQKEEAKQLESFLNFAPTLHTILTDPHSPVKTKHNLCIGPHALNVIYIETEATSVDEVADLPALHTLISTCLQICQEISSTTHLAIWRRYLRTVWLHE